MPTEDKTYKSDEVFFSCISFTKLTNLSKGLNVYIYYSN